MPTISSIKRGADILRSLSAGVDRVSDLSRNLQLSKSTVHRFLKSLEENGFVMQDTISRRYYLGPLVLDLASRPLIVHQNLSACAFEDMRHLRDLTRETVVLHIRMGLERLCLEELQGLENIKYAAGKGFIAPLHTGSAGKVLLSELKEEDLEPLLRNLSFEKIGPNTITDRKAFKKELEKVRKQGYATSFGERVRGSASISVPIRGYLCPVALSLLGPDNRFSFQRMMEHLEAIQDRAVRISQKLRSYNHPITTGSGV
jgi:DNA-binding IclR family transcriptional regulator